MAFPICLNYSMMSGVKSIVLDGLLIVIKYDRGLRPRVEQTHRRYELNGTQWVRFVFVLTPSSFHAFLIPQFVGFAEFPNSRLPISGIYPSCLTRAVLLASVFSMRVSLTCNYPN